MKIILSLLFIFGLAACEEEDSQNGSGAGNPETQSGDFIQTGRSLSFDCLEASTRTTIELDAEWSTNSLIWLVSYVEKSRQDKVIKFEESAIGRKHFNWPRIILFKGSKELGYVAQKDIGIAELTLGNRKFDCEF